MTFQPAGQGLVGEVFFHLNHRLPHPFAVGTEVSGYPLRVALTQFLAIHEAGIDVVVEDVVTVIIVLTRIIINYP